MLVPRRKWIVSVAVSGENCDVSPCILNVRTCITHMYAQRSQWRKAKRVRVREVREIKEREKHEESQSTGP